MTRLARAEVYDPSEVAVLHLCARVVRRCFLFGVDPASFPSPRDHISILPSAAVDQFGYGYGAGCLLEE